MWLHVVDVQWRSGSVPQYAVQLVLQLSLPAFSTYDCLPSVSVGGMRNQSPVNAYFRQKDWVHLGQSVHLVENSLWLPEPQIAMSCFVQGDITEDPLYMGYLKNVQDELFGPVGDCQQGWEA